MFGVLLRCFGAGWGVRLGALRQVFSLVPVVMVSCDHSIDAWGWRLWVLDDTELSVVLVVVAVPVGTRKC